MQRLLLVDGHSMIFAWPELRSLHGQAAQAARDRLVQALEGLHAAGTWQVAVVFDGRGAQPSEVTVPGGVQVFYSRAGQTADTLLERFVARHAASAAVTVATDDLLERQTIEALGATGMDSRGLRAEIERAANDLAGRLSGFSPPRPRKGNRGRS